MNDFTKEELKYFLMIMKPFHFLWRNDPLELEEKLKSMIDNYCEHENIRTISYLDYIVICRNCEKILR